MKELHANCLCGAVALTLPDQFDYMGNCHCSECRKFSGEITPRSADWMATRSP